jgi:hypothetical protein
MSQQSDRPPPRPIFSRSSSRSHTSSFRENVSRYRYLLYFLVGVALLLMALGVLFVAHRYYEDFGGQGWLKVRDESQDQAQLFADNVFLPLKKPLKKVEVWNADSAPWRRSPQNDVPYYECGDQENSCEIYSQPVSRILCYADHGYADTQSRTFVVLPGRFVTRTQSLPRASFVAMLHGQNSNVKPPNLTHHNA